MRCAAKAIAPKFIERLQSKAAREGQSIRFTVRVEGKPEPDVTWFREGAKIVSSPDFEIRKDGDVHSLVIPEVFCEDSGKFTAVAENSAGQVVCTAELLVEGKLMIVYLCLSIDNSCIDSRL